MHQTQPSPAVVAVVCGVRDDTAQCGTRLHFLRNLPARADSVSGTWYVYILCCADGSLYTGVARDLPRRLRQHNGELAGGPRYTRGRRPVRLIWSEAATDRGAALSREAAIKRLDRDAKLLMIDV